MTISVALRSDGTPAFDVTIASPDGSALTAITLQRTALGVTANTRVQPITGLPSITITDYEAPWDTDVVYSANVTHGGTAETYTAASASLSASGPWLIHPTRPWLSIPLDNIDPNVMGIATVGTVTRAASSTSHPVLRSRYPVITTFGPRSAPTFPLTVRTMAAEEQSALIAITDDQMPLLLRFPAALGAAIEDGFYSVGDLAEDRVQQYVGDPGRLFTLPLTRVLSPAGTQQSLWDYPTITSTYADYGSLRAAFADYSALTADQAN